MINSIIQKVEEASQVIGRLGLYILVTSNPLSGYEGMPFEKQLIRHETQCECFSESTVFRQAWEKEIDENIL
jgi:hypothetical protein